MNRLIRLSDGLAVEVNFQTAARQSPRIGEILGPNGEFRQSNLLQNIIHLRRPLGTHPHYGDFDLNRQLKILHRN